MTRWLPLALLFSGCVINGDKYPRPRDLEPGWLVDRARVLAIRPEPPEIAPGEAATFEVLLPDPDAAVGGVLWIACAPDQTTPFGCAVDLSVLDGEPTFDELLAAGVIGIQPGFDPVWIAPEDALDALPPEARPEGLQYTIQAVALPAALDTGEEIDFADFEIGYKRIVVSEASTPNHNPDVARFAVDGVDIPEGTVVEIDAGAPYVLSLELSPDAIETYAYVNPDGVLEERVEAPYAAWYATGGQSLEDTTLYPFLDADWVAPAEADVDGSWFAVVRDRRGGMGWIRRDFRTR